MHSATASARKQRAYRLGLWAEWACLLLLICKGYRPLARRFRTPQGEVDIIARRGDTLAFVEVKARHSHRAAAEAVSKRQQRRIVQAATEFMARRKDYNRCYGRFDLMLVSPWRLPCHVVNAWRTDET